MSKNDKLKIRSDSLYKDKDNISPTTDNHSMVGINLPYEHFMTKKENISAYKAVVRSVACLQFTPIFFSSPEQEIVWQFKYQIEELNKGENEINCPEKFRKIPGQYANVWFEMDTKLNTTTARRNADYASAWESLKNAIVETLKSSTEKKKLLNYVETWKAPSHTPSDYTWHHVFMGFQKTPKPLPKLSKSNTSYYYDCNNYFSNFPQNQEGCKIIEAYKHKCLDARDWWKTAPAKFPWVEIDEKTNNELITNWNCCRNLALMQLVRTDFHQKTYKHVGSNFQRELIIGNSEEIVD